MGSIGQELLPFWLGPKANQHRPPVLLWDVTVPSSLYPCSPSGHTLTAVPRAQDPPGCICFWWLPAGRQLPVGLVL